LIVVTDRIYKVTIKYLNAVILFWLIGNFIVGYYLSERESIKIKL